MSPSVPERELLRRHEELSRLLPDDSALLLLGSDIRFRNRDVEYPFRQDSSFWYFSRLNEPGSAFLFVKKGGQVLSIIFSHEYSRDREIWSGNLLGTREAKRVSLAQESFPIEKLPELFEKHLASIKTLYFDPRRVKLYSAIKRIIDTSGVSVEKAEPLIAKLRLYKSVWELGEIRSAAEISMKAFRHIREFLESKPEHEYEVAAEITHIYEREGLTHAYPPIVAYGKNAVILHYTKNDARLGNGLLLIDSGAEYNSYASDITRMFAIGELSAEERAVYEGVKSVHEKILALIGKPNVTLRLLHEKATEHITETLIDLGLIKAGLAEAMEQEIYKKFFMHGVGHWLGLDVHDPGPGRGEESPVLSPGMCFTVEPGIYCSPNDGGIPENFRGIGVRIEDDIAVTEHGTEVLTGALPR